MRQEQPEARTPVSAEAIGACVRSSRSQAGLSLRALSRRIGLSPSFISQLEQGKAMPSVQTLHLIASELGLSVGQILDEPVRPRIPSNYWRAPSDGPVLRADNRPSIVVGSGVRWGRLTAARDPNVDFLYAFYPPNSESCPSDEQLTHFGSEYGIVLDGRLGATIGDDSYELKPGDSISFEASCPHRFWAACGASATAIWFVLSRGADPRIAG